MKPIEKPRHRSHMRLVLGTAYYSALRYLQWIKMRAVFAKEKTQTPIGFCAFAHKSLLLRKLKDVDMWLQTNKIHNLKLAVKQLDGVVLRPGQVLSYWRLIGKPTKRKGYVEGMVLCNGTFTADVGGGLCQLSNLIFWMTLHTPLTVVERYRHGYDVFPDSNRTQPFGSGATCFYPHGDLMIRNDTSDTYQLRVHVGETFLHGEWRSDVPCAYRYTVVEKNHTMQREAWGGYSRHNTLFQQRWSLDGQLLDEHLVVENSAIMMYAPFLDAPKQETP